MLLNNQKQNTMKTDKLGTLEKPLSPDAIAFDKLWFINRLSSNPAAYRTAHEAMLNERSLAEIVKALTPKQLAYLIQKIESIL